jgi:hypothetical protein
MLWAQTVRAARRNGKIHCMVGDFNISVRNEKTQQTEQ